MEIETNNYFSNLTVSLAALLEDILKEKGFSLFKNSSKVQVGKEGQSEFCLYPLARTVLFEDKGTFNQESIDGRLFVYRNPIRLSTQFRLSSQRLSMESQLRALDKLTQYFFDNRTIEPIVPHSFNAIPTLFEKLSLQKADLKALSSPEEPHHGGFNFTFEYIALYHSGTLLREESRVKTRTIQMGSVPNGNSGMGNTERSVS